jgi:hypothetical protein
MRKMDRLVLWEVRMNLRGLFVTTLLVVLAALLTIKIATGHRRAQTPTQSSQTPAQSAPTPDLGSLSDAALKGVTVHFERTGCYGNCPAYTVTLHGDGRVEYAGKDNVKVKGTRAGRIEPATVKALMAEFARAKFLAIADQLSGEKCSCGQCTDMPSVITELSVGDTQHSVEHYYGCRCAPKALFELEAAIDKAVNVEQWTGDVSKQGPFGTTCFGP